MASTRQMLATVCMVCSFFCGRTMAGDEFEQPPVSYSKSTPENCVSRLQQQLESGQVSLTFDADFGYLPDVLKALDVPVESQMLVFSKTSLQMRRISPRTPRAIYFNDDVYIGFCQNGDLLEVSAVDPQLGAVFYTLDQEPSDAPRFVRSTDNCLVCHSSSRTEGVPGHLVRSLYVDEGGMPILSAGSRIVDHTTPLEQRWGGWYVTGLHGGQNHLGNLVIREKRVSEPVDNSAGQNVTSLKERIDTSRYLSPFSDIVALMVLEHQTLVHNHITKTNFATRQALAYEKMMNEALGYPPDNRLDSTKRRIQHAADDLVDAMLMVREARLTEPVEGTSGFAQVFTHAGPRDSQGRSLRDLDLKTRLFRYPCSYLIYSDAFRGLPAEAKDYIWHRLSDILTGRDSSDKYAHLTPELRASLLQILSDTVADAPTFPVTE